MRLQLSCALIVAIYLRLNVRALTYVNSLVWLTMHCLLCYRTIVLLLLLLQLVLQIVWTY